VPAVHTEVLAGRCETCRWMSAAAGASGDRVLAIVLHNWPYGSSCVSGERIFTITAGETNASVPTIRPASIGLLHTGGE